MGDLMCKCVALHLLSILLYSDDNDDNESNKYTNLFFSSCSVEPRSITFLIILLAILHHTIIIIIIIIKPGSGV